MKRPVVAKEHAVKKKVVYLVDSNGQIEEKVVKSADRQSPRWPLVLSGLAGLIFAILLYDGLIAAPAKALQNN
jgi:hypothetical protein